MNNCPSCGDEMQIGDWPFCGGPGSHESIYRQDSQRFDPIVLHRDPLSGEYSVPMHSSDPTPHGYEKIEIRTMREADKHIRYMDAREREKAVGNREMNRLYFEERTKERREKVDSLIRAGKLSGRAQWLAENARKMADAKHEKRFAKTLNPNCHFQALSFDSSNRMSYASKETGYRDVKR